MKYSKGTFIMTKWLWNKLKNSNSALNYIFFSFRFDYSWLCYPGAVLAGKVLAYLEIRKSHG